MLEVKAGQSPLQAPLEPLVQSVMEPALGATNVDEPSVLFQVREEAMNTSLDLALDAQLEEK